MALRPSAQGRLEKNSDKGAAMDRISCMKLFIEVARSESFAKAADKLAISGSAVSKQIAWFEQSIGAQLFTRTTKKVTLTQLGQQVLEETTALLASFERIESMVQDATHSPKGALRIGTPPSFGSSQLTPLIVQFQAVHPDIDITLVNDNGKLDLTTEALDIAIRVAPVQPDSSYIAMPLFKMRQILVASPQYLNRTGRPSSLDDLKQHSCIINSLLPPGDTWNFSAPVAASVRVKGPIKSAMGDVLKQAAIQGAGISMHPIYMVADELKNGTLEAVLADHVPKEIAEISAIYSTRKHQPSRVKLMLDYLKAWAHQRPAWTELGSVAKPND